MVYEMKKGGSFMSQSLKRHNILFSDEDWLLITDKAKELKISASELIRKTVIKEIKHQEEIDLLNYINQNCGFASEKEEKDIMKILKDVDPEDEGVELTLEDILQG